MKNVKCLSILCSATLLTVTAATVLVGCAGDRYHESTGEYVDDSALTGRVKSALGHSDYKFDGVKVTSFKGEVQLSGFVNTSDQKSQAADIAKNVEGVRSVDNNISVKS
ncbi:MAG TPA: BON domain-containing protein [Verrucomicrobiae bacterium]|jgi:osmotically-inducible protein OsmY